MVMLERKAAVALLVVLSIVTMAGCSDSSSEAEPAASAPTKSDPTARTLAIPGGELTQGHSETDGHNHSTQLAWEAPADWIVETPRSNMRFAQYRVPGPGGDGECVVFYFGPGQGGDPMANAQRWAGQFLQPDGSSSLDKMSVEKVDGARVPIEVVKVVGTYTGGMTMTTAPAEDQPGYMLLAAIAEGPDAPWFFKFTGPESTVRAQRDQFWSMLKTVGPDER